MLVKSVLGPRAGFVATTLLAMISTSDGHSWIERAVKIDTKTNKFVGAEGFSRGYVNRSDPSFTDNATTYRLPYTGTGFYTGDEKIAQHPYNANPDKPMLEAGPGDYIAILHYENGHTTKPQTNPTKPYNRGTIFLYGTSEPKDDEKLFDVHLKWDQDGSGGDKRGKLLATRNYDDGQCHEARNDGLALERATALGIDPLTPLACQSDLQLPSDLKPGTVYTIYWYWDWPNLNPEAINMTATENGVYPWAGTFMRGEKDPNGFTMNAIATNESYASTLDIKIVDNSGSAAKAEAATSHGDGAVFNMAIPAQLKSNYGVPVHEADGNNSSQQPPSASYTSSPSSVVAPTQTGAPADGPVTVTVTEKETVPPTTVVTTVYATGTPPLGGGCGANQPCQSTVIQTVIDVDTQYTTVYPEGTPTDSGNLVPPQATTTPSLAPMRVMARGTKSLTTLTRPATRTVNFGGQPKFTPLPPSDRTKHRFEDGWFDEE